MPAVRRIAARHPGLRLTIDHLGGKGGNTTLKDAAAMTHMPALLALAKYPNVAVKATGVPWYSSEPYPFRSMADKGAGGLRLVRLGAPDLRPQSATSSIAAAPSPWA